MDTELFRYDMDKSYSIPDRLDLWELNTWKFWVINRRTSILEKLLYLGCYYNICI